MKNFKPLNYETRPLNTEAFREQTAKVISDLRAKENLTCSELAETLEASPGIVTWWNSGKSTPTIGHLQRLYEVYKVDPKEFFIKED